MNRQICMIFLLLGGVLLAQDSIQEPYDSKYREDQFYIGITYNVITDIPDDVATTGLSGGIHFGFLRDMPINERRNIAVALGAGMSIDRYGQTLFVGEDTNNQSIFSVLDSDVDYSTNYLTSYTAEAPLEFRWRSSNAETYKFWRVYAGFRLGYAFYYRTTFKQAGNTVNQTDIAEFDRLRLGTSFSFGYNTFNFYVYYSINPFFENATTTEGQAIDFRTVKVGLMFYIL
ncbi:PorT family protein [Aureitalea sp. L0-47]|uniref:PorT family protein n=1 Tax=Aureitalea sp. L0-47 TaxID=2816962 RepID=UPI0022386A32|nr:PorT family protein [Aureitalea sp. L0-47]MCW5518937.1 PorT family protein [Aureitalea sp. L0-47]